MRGHFDLFSMLIGLLIFFALVILARWRMQLTYVRNGGVLDNTEKPEPEMSAGKVVRNGFVFIALYLVTWKTTYEIAHLAVAAIVIGLAWQCWQLTKVYKVNSAVLTDRLSIYALLALGVIAMGYSV